MKKPCLCTKVQEYWDYHELEKWITFKTKKDPNDWAGKHKSNPYDENIPYQNFWHWITDKCEIHNGCYFYLMTHPEDYMYQEAEDWQKEIMDVLNKSFPEAAGEFRCWVSW